LSEKETQLGVLALREGFAYCVPKPALQGQAFIGVPFLAIAFPVLDQFTVDALVEAGLKVLDPKPELQEYTKIGVVSPVPTAK
jgi:hypothetical protein